MLTRPNVLCSDLAHYLPARPDLERRLDLERSAAPSLLSVLVRQVRTDGQHTIQLVVSSSWLGD